MMLAEERPEPMTIGPQVLIRRCAVCSAAFEHEEGGTCAQCGEAYCARHLHGPWWRRWWRRANGHRVCERCRAESIVHERVT